MSSTTAPVARSSESAIMSVVADSGNKALRSRPVRPRARAGSRTRPVAGGSLAGVSDRPMIMIRPVSLDRSVVRVGRRAGRPASLGGQALGPRPERVSTAVSARNAPGVGADGPRRQLSPWRVGLRPAQTAVCRVRAQRAETGNTRRPATERTPGHRSIVTTVVYRGTVNVGDLRPLPARGVGDCAGVGVRGGHRRVRTGGIQNN